MEQPPLDLVGQVSHLPSNWLIGYNTHQFTQLVEQLHLELIQISKHKNSPKIILAERNPVRFLAGFIVATAAGCPVFLCNPDWVKAEWQQVFELVQPDIIWGQLAKSNIPPKNSSIPNQKSQIQNRIMIPTGGSSGEIRFAIHTWETLTASVQGFIQYFDINTVNSFCVLPLYHVSGLMQFMRSFLTGGKLAIMPFKAIEAGEKCEVEPAEFFISLVPTQLQRLLQSTPQWLSQFQTVLLGGATAWHELLEQARHHEIRLALTYGMTETASQIVTLKPEDFIKGNNSCGQVLPHAQVKICSPNGEILGVNKAGIISIEADSLALGYYPDRSFVREKQGVLQLDDLGFFDEQGYLNIVGRNSNKIITGGENVFPSEVEAAIRSTDLVSDVCVIGIPDRHWGQAVTAVYVPKHPAVDTEKLQTAILDKLSNFKRPKYWIPVESLLRNAQGKINREQIQQIAILSHPDRSNLAASQ
ncbi:2-succinylbenzoate--CoA ligase [Planktothrix sp. FACHB-1355]|uniref:2-succinylbenzoate--CoA ligase n=1 Tax=Aerosakkonema funiforme FACHB-1375 TaxID=2949571 RepID=A0A926VCD3_9CYAN|nr:MULTISPECIES: 2-succinylbenzoate--CoA ligase [Oscillatoriales]MBD2180282.1 2-succinylbenzoate--CoA ligase [Aerosakkonema funiforme FACHB-1375]MBD3558850.1 2-succinylbenzoate--CoA ligase [Planktothrix sp. FACHB-1355]